RDQLLGHAGAVGIRGVDQRDAEVDGSTEDRLGLLAVRRVTQHARTGDPHRAEAEPVDGQIPEDERAGCGGVRLRPIHGRVLLLDGWRLLRGVGPPWRGRRERRTRGEWYDKREDIAGDRRPVPGTTARGDGHEQGGGAR